MYLAESLVPQGANAELLRAARVGIKISSGNQVLATNIFELDIPTAAIAASIPRPPRLALPATPMACSWAGKTASSLAVPT